MKKKSMLHKSKNILNTKFTLLITGGTGTFGKAFTATILKEFPNIKKIIIYSRDEFKQNEMANLPEFNNNPKLRFFIGDVRDRDRLMRAFDNVDVVVHAAALKQIPSCENNPFETIKTNINGAQNVIDAAIDRGVERVVALSTDKACQPINLYGATKLCSDKLFIAGNAYAGGKQTRFSVVRYGNVMGSRGSVVPYFQKLIQDGAKFLPITDINMTRFWLQLDEAVDLVIHALENMVGGELFIKKIPSIRIIDLAKAMAPKLPIKEVGVRPSEKIHEMLISSDDARHALDFPDQYVIQPSFPWWADRSNYTEGKPVEMNFEYHSGNNSDWLNVSQIRKLLGLI